MARLHGVSFFAALLLCLWSASGACACDTVSIELDCSRVSGEIRSFSGINCGPIPVHTSATQTDLTPRFREIGIDMVRTHDFYGPTDVSAIFPDWSADPTDASRYDFAASDAHVASIVDGGFEVFFRLGESASDNDSLRQPPPDFDRWAEVCRHIVMHYNEGWADGYRHGIRYWEIWNEPDLEGFWAGTAEAYYELYGTTAALLKQHDPDLKIGGPCTSHVGDERFAGAFLDYVTFRGLPLDFYSWHTYTDSPHELYRNATNVRALLDSYGLEDCENINTEWNIDILSPQRDKDNAKNAAFTACSLAVFQDAGIDRAFRYRATQDDSSRLGLMLGFDLSLFTADGTYKRPALSYLAMQHLYRDSPLRLAGPAMDAADGITWLAGTAADGSCVSVLISRYETDTARCDLHIDNLPFTSGYTVARYLIDERRHLEVIEQTSAATAAWESSFVLEKNSVVLLRLSDSTAHVPPDGPEVAEIPPLLQLEVLDPFFSLLSWWLLFLIFG